MRFWRPFYVYCPACGHRNRPHNSPREGIRRLLLGLFNRCRHCGHGLDASLASDRPLVREVLDELRTQGLLPSG